MSRIKFLIWKELIELRQDPRLISIVVMAPIIQLVALGYAATTDVVNVPVVIADTDRSQASRDLITRFSASPTFSVVDIVSAADEIDPFLEDGRAWLAIAIPPAFGSAIAAGRPQTVQIVADGSDASSAGVSLGYATSLITAYGQDLAARAATRNAAPHGGGALEARVRVWYNPQLESREFMIPGILALLLLVITTNLSSMGIVREREIGTLEQLNVTPLRRWELIAGKLLPYAMVGLVDVVLVLGVSVFWFEVPLRGSVALLFAMTFLYLLSTLGLGLFVSTISSTQQQAMMTTTFFFLMPMIYLSGFIFPIENMPAPIQTVTYFIPLRYFLVILRSIFLKGVGLETFWPEALALAACGATLLGLAIARLSKRAS
jgi:ABC-2 type transport system permease protein